MGILLAQHSVSSSRAIRTKAGTAIQLLMVHPSGINQLFCSGASKSVSLHRLLWATSPHHSSSLQHLEKTSPSSVKGNHINIKKTEGLIKTDILYYGICKSIYELCDVRYRNQEAITILWGKIINLSNALPLCAYETILVPKVMLSQTLYS